MSTKYCQCELVKTVGIELIRVRQIAFIPEKLAKVGTKIKLRQGDGKWDDGWEVWSSGEPTEIVMDIHKAIRNHRKNTGDSLPK